MHFVDEVAAFVFIEVAFQVLVQINEKHLQEVWTHFFAAVQVFVRFVLVRRVEDSEKQVHEQKEANS